MTGLFGRIIGSLVTLPVKRSENTSECANLDYEILANQLSTNPHYRVLRAINSDAGVEKLSPLALGTRVAAVVDTETTGLDPAADQIVELAVQRFTFDAEHRIVEVERPRSWLEDPRRPLPGKIARLTGISDGDLSGQRFDDETIVAIIGRADIVIAHNAAFDRPFLERRFPLLDNLPWACSLSQLDWLDLGYDGRALGHLLLQSGWFFEGHRAGNDTSALVTLLGTVAPDGRAILAHLMENCDRESVRIDAVGAPYSAKDLLKGHGYRWDPTRRLWWREIDDAETALETAWLDQHVYDGRGRPQLVSITPRTRFKRVGTA